MKIQFISAAATNWAAMVLLIHNIGVDQPHERIVVDPIANQLGAVVLRRNCRLESGDARHDDGRVDNASMPSLRPPRRQPLTPV